MVEVELHPYSPEWPALFEIERASIEAALGGSALAIHHTGSTSVPGLSAKPIIDITLVVADSTDEAAYIPSLLATGMTLRRREPDWYEHRLLRRADPTVNLHIFSDGCVEIERMLVFRDHLRASPEDRRLYEDTKRALARSRWPTIQHYAEAKSEVIAEILGRASGSSGD